MHPLRPSTDLRQPWLILEAPGEIFASSDISGKWCIFRAPTEVDEAWRVVSGFVMAGKLLAAKVSTAQGVVFGGYERHVICVYTRDWQDKDDVQRVREVLRSAGFDERLQYKRDADTAAGIERFVYES